MDDPGGEGARYRAFISYSHKDAAFGRRLHRRLEAYRIPRRLIGREGPRGPVPARLAPIFRDREELAAAHDLTAEIRAALAGSASLVVVCSPHGAASPWVAREIELFRDLHPDRPILAAVAEGEPADCFPEVLRRAAPGRTPVEPLAADLRPGHDGAQLGLLKLVAGITGVGLDELVQRDAQRRVRAVTAVTAAALVAAVAMGLLTAIALDARSQAERQRAEAEGLVEFMLTDLRTRLKGVGRIDVLSTVNKRALAYYSEQELRRLPVASLERRARVLHAMGQDDMTLGESDRALKEFREADRATAALLKAAPNDPDRIFTHAQSEFWLGYVDFDRDRFAEAEPAFRAYKLLAERLLARAPNDPRYLREAGYAEGNLCSVAMRLHRPSDALRACKSALDRMLQAGGARPSPDVQHDLINRHAWMADAYLLATDLSRAKSERILELSMLEKMITADPKNIDLKQDLVSTQLALAVLDRKSGQQKSAITRLTEALSLIESMSNLDRRNVTWKTQKSLVESELHRLHSTYHSENSYVIGSSTAKDSAQ